MPGTITHVYVADKIMEKMPDQTQEILRRNLDVYHLGATGSDVLFVLREVGHRDERMANAMHNTKVGELFARFVDSLKHNYSETKFAYALGYLAHYAADRIAHPFVNYFVENYLPKELPAEFVPFGHNLIESAGDMYVAEILFKNKNIKIWKHIRPSRPERYAVGRFYGEAVNPIYGSKLSAAHFSHSVRIFKAFMHLTYDPKCKKRKLFTFLERIMSHGAKQLTALSAPPFGLGSIDYLNLAKRPYRAVRNEPFMIDMSYPQIVETSILGGINYFKMFLKAVEGGPALVAKDFSINFDGVRV